MGTVYGSIDAGRDSCVLLYDIFGNSYAGEPTINLFTQPSGNSAFSIKPAGAGRIFNKLDYYANVGGQGTFSENASGAYLKTDSIYKYTFSTGETDSSSNKHGFTINIVRGETYTVATDIYVSTGHPRTGPFPVVSLTPNLTGSFATVTGTYNGNLKGTWQSFKQKIYIPSPLNQIVSSANYYEVSVSAKTALHPYYGNGSSDGFKIGTGESPTLNLYKGNSYIFSQTNSSNLNDQFYLSTIPNAGGESNFYANGFTYYGNKGLDGYAVFTVPYDAPLILYYNSLRAASSYFGGRINILGGYSIGNLGNAGCVGSLGSLGSSESYAVCFDPTRSELTDGNLGAGYILYKNMQFEKNKPMFRGIIHPTKFTSTSRSAVSSLLDLTAGNNNASLTHAMFDSDSFILFGNKTNSSNGGVIDINLKYNTTKTFSIGSSATQSYDFWFKQIIASFQTAYLFSRSSSVSNSLFVKGGGSPQLIFIQNQKIYFSFSASSGKILYGYSDGVINLNTLYNVVITVNTQLATGLKVDVYLNGQLTTVTILTDLSFPLEFAAVSSVLSVGNLGNSGNLGSSNVVNFYCVSSYNTEGESKASTNVSVSSDPLKKSIKLSWQIVDQAIGYYIYKSSSPSFGDYSLLAKISSKNILTFTDENSQNKLGRPKNFSNSIYDADVVAIPDDLNAKTCFGDYPTTTLVPSYFEGYIYRIAIYKTKLTSTQVYKNYNSFLYKYISESPATIASPTKQRSVIYKRVRN